MSAAERRAAISTYLQVLARNDEIGMEADDVGSEHVASEGHMELGKLERARHHGEAKGERCMSMRERECVTRRGNKQSYE